MTRTTKMLQAEARVLHDVGGFGYRRIARRLGVSRDNVRRWLRTGQPRADLDTRDWDRRALAFAFCEAGLSDRDLAAELGVNLKAAQNSVVAFRAEGIPIPRRKPGRKPR